MNESKKNWKKPALKISLSAILLYIILSRTDLKAFASNIRLMDLRLAPLILFLLISKYVVSALRWKQLLIFDGAKSLSVKYLVSLYFIGAFFNNFMPTSVGGDVYKMFQLGKKLKSKSQGFSSTFMERFTGIMALVVISYYGLIRTMSFWVGVLPQGIRSNSLLVIMFKMGLFSGFWITTIVGFFSLGFLAQKISIVQKVYDALMAYKSQQKVLLIAFLTSFIVQFFAIFTQYFILLSLGINVPISYAIFILPVITLAGFFVPSLNGLGVQDALYISFLGMVGISGSLALSASMVYHFTRLLISLIGGVLYGLGKAD